MCDSRQLVHHSTMVTLLDGSTAPYSMHTACAALHNLVDHFHAEKREGTAWMNSGRAWHEMCSRLPRSQRLRACVLRFYTSYNAVVEAAELLVLCDGRHSFSLT